jgi:hypothetical protein
LYENCKIWGPYKGKDGRERLGIKLPDGKMRWISYPKYLMENILKRYLEEDDTVDHIDGDFTNNDPSNMRVLKRSQHVTEDVIRKKPVDFVCPQCNKQFSLSGSKLNNAIRNRNQQKAGPFCSRNCAGKYGKEVQMGKDALPVAEINPEYTTVKAELSLQLETSEVEDAKTGNP